MMVRFTRKKIDTLTLGERMKKIRTDRRLSLADVSRATKIQAKYIEYLEEGKYSLLPADVYVKGFLRSYASQMGLSETMLIKQFEREKDIQKNISKAPEEEKKSISPVASSSLVVTPKMIVVMGIAVLAIGSLIYLYREVNSFVSTPRLVIIKPTDGESIDGSSIHIIGTAEKDSLVFINDQPVLVDEKGDFSEDVSLKAGLNTITVKARNRFDKEAEKSVSVNANFEQSPSEPTQATQDPGQSDGPSQGGGKITADIYVNPDPTWLSVEADGNLVYSGVLMPQSVQTFDAEHDISVTSGKGNETYIKINGKDLGVLSSDPGVVRDVGYDANGKVQKQSQ